MFAIRYIINHPKSWAMLDDGNGIPHGFYDSGITWSSWRLKSPPTQMFAPQFPHAKHKEDIKALAYCCRIPPVTAGFFSQKIIYTEKHFHAVAFM